MAEQENRSNFINIKFPAAFVSAPYQTKPNEQGKTYTQAIVTIHEGVKVNGIDLGHYKAALFANSFAMQDKLDGKPVGFRMIPDRKVDIWKGEGAERIELKVNPWDLAKAVKAEREAYAEKKAQEREERVGSEKEACELEPGPGIDELEQVAGVASDYYSQEGRLDGAPQAGLDSIPF